MTCAQICSSVLRDIADAFHSNDRKERRREAHLKSSPKETMHIAELLRGCGATTSNNSVFAVSKVLSDHDIDAFDDLETRLTYSVFQSIATELLPGTALSPQAGDLKEGDIEKLRVCLCESAPLAAICCKRNDGAPPSMEL